VIALRRQRPALRRGSFHFLWAADGVIAVARQLYDETIVAIFNASRETRRLELPLAGLVADETILAECWAHNSFRVEQGMLRRLELAPRSARMFATPFADTTP
jgi:cyclomaltodextrinase